MKKFILVLINSILVVMLFMLSGCRMEPHDHRYKEISRIDPTCETDGEAEFECYECDSTYTETLPATGHDYKETIKIKATCETAGKKELKCKNCGDSHTETIPAIAHNYKEVDTEPTCDKDGEKGKICENCGDGHIEVTPALGHNYTVSVTAATCETNGSRTYECLTCGSGYAETIYATGHSWVSVSNTMHHDEEGHYEPREMIVCLCGEGFDTFDDFLEHSLWYIDPSNFEGGTIPESEIDRHGSYEKATKDVWVVDKEAYDETETYSYCSVCGKVSE